VHAFFGIGRPADQEQGFSDIKDHKEIKNQDGYPVILPTMHPIAAQKYLS